MRRRTVSWPLAGLLALATTACAASGAEQASVRMTGELRFEPATVEVPAGGSVTWENDGVTGHTVTSIDEDREPDGAFASDRVAGTGTFSHTFEEAGTYRYTCSIHGGEMVGQVVVG